MTHYHEKLFKDETVALDDGVFISCEFVRCTLVFAGTGKRPIFNGRTKFEEPRFTFKGPAFQTWGMLCELAKGGLADGFVDIERQMRKADPTLP